MSKSFKADVIAAGRITIPLDIRRELSINEGDTVRVNITKITLIEKEVIN